MYQDEIDAFIDGKRKEMLTSLETLVRIDSERGPAKEGKPFGEGPAAALSAARKMMRLSGLTVTDYENYVVTGDLNEKEKGLDILAHLDVVPVTNDWTVTKPFEPKIVDGKIYGRGTADDKGPAVAALYALRAIRELGIPMKKNVRLILGSDEECGSGDLMHYYSIEKEAPYTFTPDADFPVINIEKGRMEGHFEASFLDGDVSCPGVLRLKSGDKANVVPARADLKIAGVEESKLRRAAEETEKETGVRFLIRKEKENTDVYDVEAHGLAAHASTPSEGKNALAASLRFVKKLPRKESEGQRALEALERLFPYEDTCGRSLGVYREEERSGEVTCCLSILDYTPERMQGTFDMRLPIGCNEENTKQPIRRLFSLNGISLHDEPMVRPHLVPEDSAFVKILLDTCETYTGIPGKALSTGGGTYVHDLERGVAYGCMTPEVDNHMHADDEFMVIDTMLMSAKIFANAAVRICNEL